MTDDIVDRLRDTAYETDVCWEAASEIERLRKESDYFKEKMHWAWHRMNVYKAMADVWQKYHEGEYEYRWVEYYLDDVARMERGEPIKERRNDAIYPKGRYHGD